MSQHDFYLLPSPEQEQRLTELAHRALVHWDLGSPVCLTMIRHGENCVFSVDSARGRYAMRVHRANYHNDAELSSEFMWTAALNSDQMRTPQPLPTRDGNLFAHVSSDGVPETRHVDLLEWFDGEPIGLLEEWLECSPDELAPKLRTAGRLMGIFHRVGSSWSPPAGFTRRSWDEEAFLGSAPFWGRYWELEVLNGEQRDLLARVKPAMLEEFATIGKGADRYGLIHSDFMPENLLDDGTTICLIDFDDVAYGWYMYEFAGLLFFFFGAENYSAAVDAVVEGYRTEHALDDEQLRHLPLFMLMRGLGFLGWVHDQRERDLAKLLTPVVVPLVERMAREYLA